MQNPAKMNVVEMTGGGGPEVLVHTQAEIPKPAAGEVLIKVAAAGVNGPDLMQRRGLYPAPAGASHLLGLEVSGQIVATGTDVTAWKTGDNVAALTNGGGYATLHAHSRWGFRAGCSRLSRNILYGLEQSLHGGRPQGGRAVARSWGSGRHWHDRHSDRQGTRG